MKSFYTAPKKTWQESIHLFSESHYLDTDDPETVLVVCEFSSHANADSWEAKPGVEIVPHPMMDSTTPAQEKHISALKGIGVKQGDKVSDVVKRAGEVHSAFKTHRL